MLRLPYFPCLDCPPSPQVSRGKVIELWRLEESARLMLVAQTEVFGLIRTLVPFRLTGGSRDYVLATSDSGRLSLLEFDGDKKKWKTVHQETFGKSGEAKRERE